MMIDDVIYSTPREAYNLPHASWLAGAAKGLQLIGSRTPTWLWDDFIADILAMIELLGDLEPAEPGTAPIYGDGLIGSAFDSLGGYVSVVGEICPEGLYFRVPVARQEDITQLLKGLTVYKSQGEIIIPLEDLPAFTRLVPLDGPIAELVELEVAP